jgi:hypothetical protein
MASVGPLFRFVHSVEMCGVADVGRYVPPACTESRSWLGGSLPSAVVWISMFVTDDTDKTVTNIGNCFHCKTSVPNILRNISNQNLK